MLAPANFYLFQGLGAKGPDQYPWQSLARRTLRRWSSKPSWRLKMPQRWVFVAASQIVSSVFWKNRTAPRGVRGRHGQPQRRKQRCSYRIAPEESQDGERRQERGGEQSFVH